MADYWLTPSTRLMHGDVIDELRELEDESVDSVVTDPPYHLTANKKGGTGDASVNLNSPAGRSRISTGFMGKDWDGGDIAYSVEMWKEVLRVLKPGGYLLAFGGTRTCHRMVCAIEDAGFIIQDQIDWIYGSGFPKSMDISKAIDKAAGAIRATGPVDPARAGRLVNQQGAYETEAGWSAGNRKTTIDPPTTDEAKEWDGWGTSLKPAHEPICVAKKPISEKTIAKNVLKHGVGGLNIDGCRIEVTDAAYAKNCSGDRGHANNRSRDAGFKMGCGKASTGRFPANVIMDEEAGRLLDLQTGTLKSGDGNTRRKPHQTNAMAGTLGQLDREEVSYGDEGGASRFFYCPKSSRTERNHGLVKSIELLEVEIRTWEKEAYLVRLLVDTDNSHLKVTEGFGIPTSDVGEWNTLLFGKSLTALSHEGCRFIIETSTNWTTESPTLNFWMQRLINESIPAAYLETESGTNLAVFAKNESRLQKKIGSSLLKAGRFTDDADPATLRSWLQRSKSVRLRSGPFSNIHATVKPVSLMSYLVRLVTPPGGTVLDPFVGSGTTAVACKNEGLKRVCIDQELLHLEITKARLKAAANK